MASEYIHKIVWIEKKKTNWSNLSVSNIFVAEVPYFKLYLAEVNLTLGR